MRSKKSLNFGRPEESITQAKMKRLRACALRYLEAHQDLPSLWRIDVVAIQFGARGKVAQISLIENAIEGS